MTREGVTCRTDAKIRYARLHLQELRGPRSLEEDMTLNMLIKKLSSPSCLGHTLHCFRN